MGPAYQKLLLTTVLASLLEDLQELLPSWAHYFVPGQELSAIWLQLQRSTNTFCISNIKISIYIHVYTLNYRCLTYCLNMLFACSHVFCDQNLAFRWWSSSFKDWIWSSTWAWRSPIRQGMKLPFPIVQQISKRILMNYIMICNS